MRFLNRSLSILLGSFVLFVCPAFSEQLGSETSKVCVGKANLEYTGFEFKISSFQKRCAKSEKEMILERKEDGTLIFLPGISKKKSASPSLLSTD